ncbi:ankyrin repeat domain-containing protein 45-like [Corticium candelabrum]|uniref:ankyrin repeat domain-containing protein 45-like n=1 Tax=Corticium candelabrum TaxID=121492 RepID=UPI002E26F01F|nr:ankyrin repeat domain-containing protein 45-like [Corticium candelabrum]
MSLNLHEIVARGDVEVLKESIEDATDLLDCDAENRTVLDLAAILGRSECLSELIKLGAEVDRCTESGYTALHRAALWGHLDCVRALVQGGADITKKTRHNERAQDSAARYCHDECVRYLNQIEAWNVLKAYVEELRSVLTDTERIAGKWGKDDKSKTTAACNEKATWLDMNTEASSADVYKQMDLLKTFMQPIMAKLEPPDETKDN